MQISTFLSTFFGDVCVATASVVLQIAAPWIHLDWLCWLARCEKNYRPKKKNAKCHSCSPLLGNKWSWNSCSKGVLALILDCNSIQGQLISLETVPSGVSGCSGPDSRSNWKFPEIWVAGVLMANTCAHTHTCTCTEIHLHCTHQVWRVLQPESVNERRMGRRREEAKGTAGAVFTIDVYYSK